MEAVSQPTQYKCVTQDSRSSPKYVYGPINSELPSLTHHIVAYSDVNNRTSYCDDRFVGDKVGVIPLSEDTLPSHFSKLGINIVQVYSDVNYEIFVLSTNGNIGKTNVDCKQNKEKQKHGNGKNGETVWKALVDVLKSCNTHVNVNRYFKPTNTVIPNTENRQTTNDNVKTMHVVVCSRRVEPLNILSLSQQSWNDISSAKSRSNRKFGMIFDGCFKTLLSRGKKCEDKKGAKIASKIRGIQNICKIEENVLEKEEIEEAEQRPIGMGKFGVFVTNSVGNNKGVYAIESTELVQARGERKEFVIANEKATGCFFKDDDRGIVIPGKNRVFYTNHNTETRWETDCLSESLVGTPLEDENLKETCSERDNGVEKYLENQNSRVVGINDGRGLYPIVPSINYCLSIDMDVISNNSLKSEYVLNTSAVNITRHYSSEARIIEYEENEEEFPKVETEKEPSILKEDIEFSRTLQNSSANGGRFFISKDSENTLNNVNGYTPLISVDNHVTTLPNDKLTSLQDTRDNNTSSTDEEYDPLMEFSSRTSSVDSLGDHCRVCHCGGDEELISPCHCNGSLKYVHESCLITWMKSPFKDSCEICKKEIVIVKKRKPITKWKLPIQRPTPLVWVIVFTTAICVNLMSVIKDATRKCVSTSCIVFYVIGSVGIILASMFLYFWVKRVKVFCKSWLVQNEHWVVKTEHIV